MKKIVWLFGGLLLLSFFAPDPGQWRLPKAPAAPEGPVDERIVSILRAATPEDKARVRDVYSALKTILARDAGKRVATTEQWSDWAANTLQLAIDTPGKYKDLDLAIEGVFLATVGTDDVLPGNEDTRKKLSTACDIIVNSASR